MSEKLQGQFNLRSHLMCETFYIYVLHFVMVTKKKISPILTGRVEDSTEDNRRREEGKERESGNLE